MIEQALKIIKTFGVNTVPLEMGMKDRTFTNDDEIMKKAFGSYGKSKKTNPPKPYKNLGEWERVIATMNLDRNHLRNFFRNNLSHGLIWGDYKELSGSNTKRKIFMNEFMGYYSVWKNHTDNEIWELDASATGNSWGCYMEGNLIMPISFMHNYFVHIVKKLLKDIENPVVCEIGGGFGGFAYYLSKLYDDKYNKLTYINFDLSEIILICSYYLMNNFPDKKICLFDESRKITKEMVDDYDIILLPNFELPNLESKSVDSVINIHSLSEMCFPTIQAYMHQINRITKRYFLHENSDERRTKNESFVETPASTFPIDNNFKKLYESASVWQKGCKQYLYEKV